MQETVLLTVASVVEVTVNVDTGVKKPFSASMAVAPAACVRGCILGHASTAAAPGA